MKTGQEKQQNLQAAYPLLNEDRKKSQFAEAYRTLRTNLYFSFTDKKLETLVVTSAAQGEGKTVTSHNLSVTMAQTGKSVLVVDADLRKPLLTKLFDKSVSSNKRRSMGLTSILSNISNANIENGLLEDVSVNDLFKLLGAQKKSGVLRVEDETHAIEITFSAGTPVGTSWLTRPNEKKLINILLKNGLITREKANMALQRRNDTGQKLGFILINMGLMTQEELKGPLTLHASEALHVLLQMRSGKFQFVPKSGTGFERSFVDPISVKELYEQMIADNENFPYLQKQINDAVIHSGYENLSVIPSGAIPPNPSEILGSEQMTFLMSLLKKQFDLVIFDTPPILAATDSLLLASQTDGIILVVRAGLMRRNIINKAVEQIRVSQGNLMGIVLNDVDIKREGYYKYYSKYSKYYSQD